jgi:integrase
MHAFRHGRVSWMRMNAVPDDLVKRQVGHSSLRTTSGYTHFSEDYQRELADKLGSGWTLAANVGPSTNEANPRLVN